MSNCRKFNFLKKYKKFVFSLLFLFLGFGIFADEVTTITINNARRTEYKKAEDTGNDSIFLDGSVELSVQKGESTSLINADKIVYDRKTEMLYAEGNVQIVSKQSGSEDSTTANSILLNTRTMEAIFDDGRVVMGNTDAFSLPEGSVLVVFSDVFGKTDTNVISFKKSSLTFCDEEDPHWQIKASRTWLLPGGEFAFLNAVLYVGPVPVMYFPAFYYPKDELVFNPVFSYDVRRGTSIQNTLYLYGRKPLEKESTLSSDDDSSAAQAIESLRSFLKPSVLKEQRLEGLILRNLDEDYKGNINNYAKIMADWYANLGFMAGFETSFLPESNIVEKFKFGVKLGFSNTVFQSGNNFYPYAQISGKKYYDKSTFLGLTLPFRYSGILELSLKKPISIDLSIPIYSDPYFTNDFVTSRKESMDWISYLLENTMASDLSETDFVEDTSYNWKLNLSYKPTIPNVLKPYINSISISTNSSVNIAAVNTKFSSLDATEIQDNWSSFTPTRKFFYPSQITPVNAKASLSGTIFQYPFSKTKKKNYAKFAIPLNKPDEIKTQKELEEDAKKSDSQTKNEETQKVEEDFYELIMPELTYSNSSISDIKGINYSLGYSVNTSFSTQLAYSSLNLSNSEDFKWDNIRSFMYTFSSPVSLNSTLSYGGNVVSMTNNISYNPVIQKHPYILMGESEGGYTESVANSLKLADYNAQKQDIVNSNNISIYPFKYLPIFNETNISWKTDLKLYRRKFLGDVENPEWEDLALDWSDPDSVTTNNLNFVLAATELENKFKQSLIFSVVMPPQLKQFNATLNLTFPYVTFSMSSGFSQKEKDSPDYKKNPLQQAISLSFFNSTLKFSESFNYNLEENHPDSLKFAASWKGISASYVMSYTTGADFDEKIGWIAKKNKEFLPYSASLTIAPTFKTYKTWFNRITFTPSINSNLVFDLIRPTNSYFTFTPKISFTISEVFTFSFSATSRNSVLYRYFQTMLGHPGRIPGEQNIFVDLMNSFRFDNEMLRKSSGFKLKSLNFEITHDLHDWDLKMTFKVEPRLITKNGVTQYNFDPYITIGVVWRPIEAIKTQIVDDYGTWKLE